MASNVIYAILHEDDLSRNILSFFIDKKECKKRLTDEAEKIIKREDGDKHFTKSLISREPTYISPIDENGGAVHCIDVSQDNIVREENRHYYEFGSKESSIVIYKNISVKVDGYIFSSYVTKLVPVHRLFVIELDRSMIPAIPLAPITRYVDTSNNKPRISTTTLGESITTPTVLQQLKDLFSRKNTWSKNMVE